MTLAQNELRPLRHGVGSLALALLAAQCSGSDEDLVESAVLGAERMLDRPVLRSAQHAAELPAAKSLALIDLVAQPECWELVNAEHRFVEDGGETHLGLPGEGVRMLRLPASCLPSEGFTLVLLRGRFPQPHRVMAHVLFGDSRAKVASPQVISVASREEQTIVLEVAALRGARTAPEQVAVLISGPAPGFQLKDVEFVAMPLSSMLPSVSSGSEPVMVDGEVREALGLVMGSPLVCDIDVRGESDELRLATGTPEAFRNRWQHLGLRLTLREEQTGELQHEERLTLAGEGVTDTGWREYKLALAPWVGRRLRLQLELVDAEPGQAIVAVADVRVQRRDPAAPSVLLISSDTHRADHVGAANSGVELSSPALDALAARGVFFEDAWSSTNITAPSHVSLLTGLHPRDTRVLTNTTSLSPSVETLAEIFRDAGYRTLAITSVAHLGQNGGFAQGFDRLRAPSGSPWDAEVAIDTLEEWLREEEGLPLFVFLHLFDAHHPYGPPGKWDRYYYPSERDPFDEALPELDLEGVALPRDLAEVRDLEFPRAQYRAEISYLDEQLGRVLGLARFEEGVVAFSSDHGEILTKGSRYFFHARLDPDTLHVPLILAGPDLPSGLRTTKPVESRDLGRTLLDAAGLESAVFPGTNLLSALEPGGEERPRFQLSNQAREASLGFRSLFMVLPLEVSPERGRRHYAQLYDRAQDPECMLDLAADPSYREQARNLRSRLVEWLGQRSEQSLAGATSQSAESLALLAELGYGGDSEGAGGLGGELLIDPDCDCTGCAALR